MIPTQQGYYPQLAISNAEGPEFQLIGLWLSTLLIENNNWQNAFAPQVNGDFNNVSLSTLLNQACFQQMSMVIEVEETGHLNWVNSMFVKAGGQPGTEPSNLSQKGRTAHDAIIAAANNLTKQKFAEFFTDPKGLITIHDGSRIQGGYYIDEKGPRISVTLT